MVMNALLKSFANLMRTRPIYNWTNYSFIQQIIVALKFFIQFLIVLED